MRAANTYKYIKGVCLDKVSWVGLVTMDVIIGGL